MVGGLSLPAGGLRGIEELPGELGLLPVDGQELGGGLEVRAGQAGVWVRAVLLGRPAAVPVGQGVGGTGQSVFDPLGVRGQRLRVEAEQPTLHIDAGLAVTFELGPDRGVVQPSCTYSCSSRSAVGRRTAVNAPLLTEHHARRSAGLHGALVAVGLALAGRAGSRLAAKLGMKVSRSTLLRLIRGLPDPPVGRVTVARCG